MHLNTLPNFFFTNSIAIDKIAKKTGQFIVSQDDQELFVDIDDHTRIPLDCIIHVESADRLPISPLDKIYIDDSTKDIYIFVGDDWAKIPCSVNTEISVTKENQTYRTKNIIASDGLEIEQDPETGDVTMAVVFSDYYLNFTAENLDTYGVLTLNDARVGTFVVMDNTGKVCIPSMTQSGTSVLINFFGWDIQGEWKIFFPMGASAGVSTVNAIVDERVAAKTYSREEFDRTIDNLTAALGTALNKHIAKTWNTDTGSYDFTITDL